MGVEVRADVFALHLACCIFPVARSAVFGENLGARSRSVEIAGEWVRTCTVFSRDSKQPFAVTRFGKEDSCHRENQGWEGRTANLHGCLLIFENTCSISYDSIKRKRNPLLFLLRPKFGESRRVGPRGTFQVRTGP